MVMLVNQHLLWLYKNFYVFWHLYAYFALEDNEESLAMLIFVKHHLTFFHFLNFHSLNVLLNDRPRFISDHHFRDLWLIIFKIFSDSLDISGRKSPSLYDFDDILQSIPLLLIILGIIYLLLLGMQKEAFFRQTR